MDRNNIEKIAQNQEDKLLLAKVWDKIQSGMRKNIPANTCFLSPRQLEMTKFLFGQQEGLISFGGYTDAERQMLVYLPDYLDESYFTTEDAPLVCLRAAFHEGEKLSHRDFLGALIGSGIARESIGDICVGNSSCDFFLTAEIAPYILQNITAAGRTNLQLKQISLLEFQLPPECTLPIKDTVASLRLDCVIASGFRMGRSTAAQYITAGKASVDGLLCEKPDKIVTQGCKISVRGLGKIKLTMVNGETKKGRISVMIDRYV